MKKYFALISFALITTVAFAQSNYQEVVQIKGESEKSGILSSSKSSDKEIARMSLGIKGGLNLSNIVVKDDEDTYSDDFKSKPGFHIGITAEFPISEIVAFETGILFSTNGFKSSGKETFGNETYEYSGSLNLLYLNIPLTSKAYFNIGQTKIFGAFGPYIGLGISGKSKSEVTTNGEAESNEQDVDWGSTDKDDLKRVDFGLTAVAGIEISAIQIGLAYNLGLANISASTEYGQKINNRFFGLSLGYKFGSK